MRSLARRRAKRRAQRPRTSRSPALALIFGRRRISFQHHRIRLERRTTSTLDHLRLALTGRVLVHSNKKESSESREIPEKRRGFVEAPRTVRAPRCAQPLPRKLPPHLRCSPLLFLHSGTFRLPHPPPNQPTCSLSFGSEFLFRSYPDSSDSRRLLYELAEPCRVIPSPWRAENAGPPAAPTSTGGSNAERGGGRAAAAASGSRAGPPRAAEALNANAMPLKALHI